MDACVVWTKEKQERMKVRFNLLQMVLSSGACARGAAGVAREKGALWVIDAVVRRLGWSVQARLQPFRLKMHPCPFIRESSPFT